LQQHYHHQKKTNDHVNNSQYDSHANSRETRRPSSM
jgi:hypothetical protein